MLAEVWARFASVPIRNAGTLGGNIANGSPIGDSMPVLIALGASVVLRRGDAQRDIAARGLLHSAIARPRSPPASSSSAIRVPRAKPRLGDPRLQGVEAIRPGHLGRVRLLSPAPRRRQASKACASAAAAWRRFRSGHVAASRRSIREAGTKRRSWPRSARWTPTSRRMSDMRAIGAVPARGAGATCCAGSGSRPQQPRAAHPRPRLRRAMNDRTASQHRASALIGDALPHESAHLHVTGEAVYVDDIVAPRGTLHAALGRSAKPHARIVALDLDAVRAVAGRGRRADRRRHSRRQRLRPGGARRSDPRRRSRAIRRAADVRGRRDQREGGAPSGAARACRVRRAARHPHASTPRWRRKSFVLPTETTGARRCRGRDRGARRTGCAGASAAAARTTSISKDRSRSRCRAKTAPCWCTARRSTRAKCSCRSRTRSAVHAHDVVGRVPAHGRRLRRQGIAGRAVRLRRRDPRAADRTRGEDARRPRRRHGDDRQAPRLPVRLRCRLRRRRAASAASSFTLASRCGFSADLSGPVNDRAMFHVDNAYFLENVAITSHRCKTNTVSETAFRGFGGPQGMFAIEYVLEEIAQYLRHGSARRAPRQLLRRRRRANVTHYTMPVEDNVSPELVDAAGRDVALRERRAEIAAWNRSSPVLKRGIALTPVKFGISFTATHYNQAGALVNVYTDGTVLLNHGGTEMGQGLYTKVAQVVAHELGVTLDRVRVTAADTTQGAQHIGDRGVVGQRSQRHGGAGGGADDPRTADRIRREALRRRRMPMCPSRAASRARRQARAAARRRSCSSPIARASRCRATGFLRHAEDPLRPQDVLGPAVLLLRLRRGGVRSRRSTR